MPRKRKPKKRLYNIWVDMRQRCKNDGNPYHDNWGNRGISVCKEWDSFETFQEWACANGYDDSLTIDRIDNDKGYCPENCRWSTYKEQANNTRKNRYVEINGEKKTVKQWCKELGIVTAGTAYRRVRD